MASDAAAPTVGADEGWQGLHPASVVVNLVPRTWATLRSAWPLLAAALYGQANGQGLFDLLLISVFFGLAIGNTVVHFLTLRYRLVDGRLEIRSGLLNRQARVISADRVQNVEMVRNIFHRMSGLVEVRIETASGTEIEGMLSALSVDDAQHLITALQAARGDAPTAAEPDAADVLVRNGTSELLWYGATGTRIGAAALLLGLAYEAMMLRGPVDPEALEAPRTHLGALTALVVVAAVTGAWLIGLGTALLRHHWFRLVRSGKGLVAEQGLFTLRRTELRLSKVQLVTIVEPWLRRAFGFGSVWVETAAAREGGDGTQRSEAAVPYVEQQAYRAVVGAAVPLDGLDPADLVLLPPHPATMTRAILLALVRSAFIVGIAVAWFRLWGLLALLVVPVSVFFAVLDVRTQGFLVTDALVVARRGWLDRRTSLLARGKLQSASVDQGPLLRALGLSLVHLRVAGSRVVLPALAHADAVALLHRLVRAR